MNDQPIFIFGTHKSGTTLLRSLLDGHKQIFAIPFETHYFKFRHYWVRSNYQNRKPGYASIDEFIEESKVYLEKLNSETYKLADGFVENQIDIERYTKSVSRMKSSLDESKQIWIYFSAIYEALEGKTISEHIRILEKSVEHAEFGLELYQMFPKAKFIHIVRNPYANVVSLRRFKCQSGHFPLYSRLFSTLYSNYYALYKNKSNIKNYYIVKYEDIVEKPESTMNRICDHLNLKYGPAVNVPTIHGRQWKGNSTSGRQFIGINSSTIEGWKNEIYEIEISIVNKLFDFILHKYNYGIINKGNSVWKPGKGEFLFRYVANRIYYKTVMASVTS